MQHTRSHVSGTRPFPAVIGTDLHVPVVSGGTLPQANLDHAATTPCFDSVNRAVQDLLPWYASVHRGAGFTSQVTSQTYERARRTVARFVGAGPGTEVVFTRNTTDAFNLLNRCLPDGCTVLRFDTDHHAALLPWDAGSVISLGIPDSPQAATERLDTALTGLDPGPKLVVIAGASNVTGELWPVAELADTARRHGARTVLDAAQLAPHRPLSIDRWQIDWVALSGHKMYAPFGAGALVGRADWLADAAPYLVGGGATAHVASGTTGAPEVEWCALPGRHEAGSPNIVGVHALATACDTLGHIDWDALITHEQALVRRLRDGLSTLPGIRPLAMWPDHPSVGVVTFAVEDAPTGITGADHLAAALSAEHAVSVRTGLFCAHVLTRHLLGGRWDTTSAVRASIGLDSTVEHVDRLITALDTLLHKGPSADYRKVESGWVPTPDPRTLPRFLHEA